MLEPCETARDEDGTNARAAYGKSQVRESSMASVLRLTSALGHEFNNQIQTMLAALELTQKLIDGGRVSESKSFIASAMRAGQSAAALHQRVASLARAYPTHLQRLNLNERVTGMSELLVRSLPRAVELKIDLAPDLWQTRCDLHQADVAILDLFFTVLDAMTGNREISITTSNRHVHDDDALVAGLAPGPYVSVEATCRSRPSKSVTPQSDSNEMPAPESKRADHPGCDALKRFAQGLGGDATFGSRDGIAFGAAFYLPLAFADVA